jgi:TonB family protein
MEEFSFYIFKSFIWLTSFALVYLLFLKNERFFLLNRLYLISGILVSIFFPLITIHYIIELPANDINHLNSHETGFLNQSTISLFPSLSVVVLFLYLSGVIFLIFKLFKQIIAVHRIIKNAKPQNLGQAKLIKTFEFSAPFVFFRYIFVNPSLNDIETKEIVNHELVHIRQKHWIDLLLAEILYIGQWFNPFAWIYIRFIRQNHEYFTDEVSLQRSSNPAAYKATLLNQMFNSQVIRLTNSFNFSLNKKRFDMMNTIITSPYRKMKLLLILPVFAIIFYSFAKTEYQYTSPVSTAKVIKGYDIQEYVKPLQDTAIKQSEDSVFSKVEVPPKFNGGDPAVEFRKYIYENIKYPQIAKEKGISGRVIVQFVVNAQGKVTDAVIAKSVDPSLDKEALRVVLSSPLWTPGELKGKPVKVFLTFPITFTLN